MRSMKNDKNNHTSTAAAAATSTSQVVGATTMKQLPVYNHKTVFTCEQRTVHMSRSIYDFSKGLNPESAVQHVHVDKVENQDLVGKVQEDNQMAHSQFKDAQGCHAFFSQSHEQQHQQQQQQQQCLMAMATTDTAMTAMKPQVISIVHSIHLLPCHDPLCVCKVQPLSPPSSKSPPAACQEGKHLSVRTDFYLEGSQSSSSQTSQCRENSDNKQLIYQIIDVFAEEQLSSSSSSSSSQQQSSFPFKSKLLQGFLFQTIGMYLTFPLVHQHHQAVVARPSVEQYADIDKFSSVSLSKKDYQITINLNNNISRLSFSSNKTGNTIEFNFSLQTLSASTQSLCYKLELLQQEKESARTIRDEVQQLPPQLQSKRVSNRHSNFARTYNNDDDDDDQDSSQYNQNYNTEEDDFVNGNEETDSIGSEQHIDDSLNSKRRRPGYTSSTCSAVAINQQPLQPKKNVVKNFVKAFRNYVNVSGDPAVLMKCLKTHSAAGLREFRAAYKKHEAANKFNNTFIKSLLTEEPFKPVFHHFVHHEAWDWLKSSSVNNKQAHKIVLSDYIKATQDLSKIEQIYSLRSRNRYPCSKQLKHE